MKKKPKRYNSLHEIIASEEFEKFKKETATTINELANRIDSQIKLFTVSMTGNAMSRRR